MKRYIPIISILFFAFTVNQQICGEESRFLITYLFPAQHPDDCEVLWITDPVDANSTEFTLRPISATSWYAPGFFSDSTNNPVSAYTEMSSINRQNRLLVQIFTKTWGEINLHRTTDYGSVLICPVKGDFAIRTFGDTDVVSCNNISYDQSLWDSKLAQILKTADFSNFDFLKYSILRRQQPIFEPVRPSCVIDNGQPPVEEGDFWLFEFDRESCCDSGDYGAFVVPTDSVRPPYFTLTPFLMDDTFICRLDDKNLFSNSKLIQVFTKTWGLCDGKFEHVLVTAIPLHGQFKRMAVETDKDSVTPIYIPVGEYTVKRELWDKYGQASINFVDYSNFDYQFDKSVVDEDLYDALEYPCPGPD